MSSSFSATFQRLMNERSAQNVINSQRKATHRPKSTTIHQRPAPLPPPPHPAAAVADASDDDKEALYRQTHKCINGTLCRRTYVDGIQVR